MTDVTRDDFVVSFKPHAGYDAPLLAIKDATAAGLADKVGSVEATGLFAIIATSDQAFKAAYNLGAGLGATPVQHPSTVPTTGHYQQPQPQQPQYPAQPQGQYPQQPAAPAGAPPGMVAPTCPHGTKKWKTGQSGRGPWKAWMCPARQGTPDQCPPEWVK